MLFLDGVFVNSAGERDRIPHFQRVKAPDHNILNLRGSHPEPPHRPLPGKKRGVLECDAEPVWLVLEEETEDNILPALQDHSITCRIAASPQQGRKVLARQGLTGSHDMKDRFAPAAQHGGFSLHAGVVVWW